jgi:NO-binding membrane sensor protein with MHYT domain
MREAYSDFVSSNDLRLITLAVFVCALGSLTATNIISHVRKTSGYMRETWLWIAATSGGTSIWATHFIANLA